MPSPPEGVVGVSSFNFREKGRKDRLVNVRECIIKKHCRAGHWLGIDADTMASPTPYWLAISPAPVIGIAGGSGVGNDLCRIRFRLQFRHYQTGEAKLFVRREVEHQNVEQQAEGTSWHLVPGLQARSAEELAAVLYSVAIHGVVPMQKWSTIDLYAACERLGLPRTVTSK